MSLWLFGDSFSVPRNDINKGVGNNFSLWHETLANRLGFVGYHNYAQWGVSNEYCLKQLLDKSHEFQPGDFVVIQLTSMHRQWFFDEHPEAANLQILNYRDFLNKNEIKALEMYVAYLDNPKLAQLRYSLYLLSLDAVCSKLDTIRILVLPGFDEFPGINGTLSDICFGEFVDDASRDAWYKTTPVDTRPNHISEKNHFILGNKIANTYIQNIPLDLSTGFETKFI